MSSPVEINTNPEQIFVTVSKKRLAELEHIEKNFDAIIKKAVKQSCTDCRTNCCTAAQTITAQTTDPNTKK